MLECLDTKADAISWTFYTLSFDCRCVKRLRFENEGLSRQYYYRVPDMAGISSHFLEQSYANVVPQCNRCPI